MSDYPNDDAMRGQTLIGFQWANTGHASVRKSDNILLIILVFDYYYNTYY